MILSKLISTDGKMKLLKTEYEAGQEMVIEFRFHRLNCYNIHQLIYYNIYLLHLQKHRRMNSWSNV